MYTRHAREGEHLKSPHVCEDFFASFSPIKLFANPHKKGYIKDEGENDEKINSCNICNGSLIEFLIGDAYDNSLLRRS